MALLTETLMFQKNNSFVGWMRLASCRVLLAMSLVPLAAVGQVANAGELDLELEVGIGHTDNITRVPDTPLNPAIDDTIYNAGLTLSYENESARSDVDMRGSLFWVDYKDGPYDSDTLPALDASALFRITEQSLRWFVQGNIGQQSIDPFEPVTPDNREDFSYITTGPSLLIPISTRFSITAVAWYSDIQYEEQPLDNNRTGAQLALVRQINPNRSFSLNVRGERTEFDEDLLFPPIDRYAAYFRFETEGSRNELSLDLGWNTSERAGIESEEPLVNLEWQRQISPATSFTLDAGTRISDAADNFRDNQGNSINIGDVQNQQGVTEPFKEDYARLSLAFSSPRTSVIAGFGWSEEDYDQQVEHNRQIQRAGLDITRQLGRSWSFHIFGEFNNFDYDVLEREDDDLRFGASLIWQQVRTVEIELRFEQIDRDSTDATGDYTENRAYLGFRYIPSLGQR